MTDTSSKNSNGTPKIFKQIREFWPLITFMTALLWGVIVMAWPVIRERADIGSHSAYTEIHRRVTAVEANGISVTRNLALITVMQAELTGRITKSEAQYKIIQIGNGSFDQTELLRILLEPPPKSINNTER